MCKVCVFAGTSEGRRLAEALARRGAAVTACTATEYGGTLLPQGENLRVEAGRLDRAGMEALLRGSGFDRVVDATHPYAAQVTENLRAACDNLGVPCLRLLRGSGALPQGAAVLPDVPSAVDYLAGTEGNILLTTGSKELRAWSALPDFASRVFARVLPLESSLTACRACGLPPAHIIAMQGPFSLELNEAMLRAAEAKILVTKAGGAPGGFEEKVEAARRAGAALVVIGRPAREEGLSYGEVLKRLCAELGLSVRPHVSVVGIGPGPRDGMTLRAARALEGAECVIGAARMLACAAPGQLRCQAVAPEKIVEAIQSHPECERFTVLLSGDVGFFSGAKGLLPRLENCDVEVIPGVSSLSYLCAKLGASYEDVTAVSLHGRDRDIAGAVGRHRRVFALVGGEGGAQKLCADLAAAGLGDVQVSVGERLGYPDEAVTTGTAAELAGTSFHSLSAVLIQGGGSQPVTPGLPDEAFARLPSVPMTKREVRAAALSALALTGDSVCWDVGAGTGSVSVEMARLIPGGVVYAVERRADALPLLEENRARFHLDNLHIIAGEAPAALEALPAPTHVFLGGSGGQTKAILALALEKNPSVRVVASAVTLESVGELTRCGAALPFGPMEAVCLTAARSREAGAYHLMTGQNPVYLFTFQGGDGS